MAELFRLVKCKELSPSMECSHLDITASMDGISIQIFHGLSLDGILINDLRTYVNHLVDVWVRTTMAAYVT